MGESSRKEQGQRLQVFGGGLGVPGLLGPSPNPISSRSPTPQ